MLPHRSSLRPKVSSLTPPAPCKGGVSGSHGHSRQLVPRMATEATFPHEAMLHICVRGQHAAGHPTHTRVQSLLLTCVRTSVGIRLSCCLKREEDRL